MPTHLTPDEHLDTIVRSGAALRAAAATAGLDAQVPTCPPWTVTKLVTHLGMVHRWAAATLRGESAHDTATSTAAAAGAPDLLAWFEEGLDELLGTLRSTPDDVTAMVFLRDAPPPRRFWARRQAHETTIHGVDALAASLGRVPVAGDVEIEPAVAADGIDELLTGFITRGKGKLHASPGYTLQVRTDDTGHAWTVHIGDGPIVTTPGTDGPADAVFSGTAAQLYLGLWNRGAEITAEGREDLLDQWRSQVRVSWS